MVQGLLDISFRSRSVYRCVSTQIKVKILEIELRSRPAAYAPALHHILFTVKLDIAANAVAIKALGAKNKVIFDAAGHAFFLFVSWHDVNVRDEEFLL